MQNSKEYRLEKSQFPALAFRFTWFRLCATLERMERMERMERVRKAFTSQVQLFWTNVRVGDSKSCRSAIGERS